MLVLPGNSNHTESAGLSKRSCASPTVSDPSATSAIQIYVIDPAYVERGLRRRSAFLEEVFHDVAEH